MLSKYILLPIVVIIVAGALMVVVPWSRSLDKSVLGSGEDISLQKSSVSAQKNDSALSGQSVVVYKEPTCGCCEGYIAELRKQGANVEVKQPEEMGAMKSKYGIPRDKQSCHTTVVGNYFVEGHVPIAAVEKLLNEKPNIDGIGLPGMPLGTPGMPGTKQAPYNVYQKNRGEFTSFVTL